MKQLLLLLSILLIFNSCTQNQDCENVVSFTQEFPEVSFTRLEKSLFKAKTPEDIKSLLKQYPLFTNKYFGIDLNDSVAINHIFHFYTNKALKEFYEDGEKKNDEFPELKSSVQELFNYIKYYFPSYRVPQVYTIVTGLPQTGPSDGIPDIIVLDSLISIGIDYYYGHKVKHRPNEYQYMLQRREPYYIVPSVAMRIAQEDFVEYDANDKTMLAEMVKWGKAHYFMKRMLPCTPDSVVIGYTSTQMTDVEKHMELIWGYFIEHQLFYETKVEEINRFVGEAPKIPVIGENCPGRIGRYLGWKIVDAYMQKNPKVTMEQLMKEVDSQKIFKLSKYKPKIK